MNQDYLMLKAAVRELQEEFKKYLEKQKVSTGATEICLQTLSEKCNVHKMKLMQLLHWSERERADFLTFDDVVDIAGLLTNSSSRQSVYEGSGPHVKKFLDICRGGSHRASFGALRRVTVPTNISLDFDNYLVLLLASMSTNIEIVLKVLEMQSYHKINKLEELGLVEVRDGKLSLVGGGYIDVPAEVLKEHVPEIEKRFSKFGQIRKRPTLWLLFGKTDEDGRKKLKEYYYEFIMKASNIFESDEGEDPTFLSLWSDTFASIDDHSEKQLSSETLNHVAHDLQKPYSMLKPLLSSFEKEQDLDKVKLRARQARAQLDTTLKSTKEMIANLRDVNLEQSLNSKPECLATLIKECLDEKFLTSELDVSFSCDLKQQKLLKIDREKVKRVINNALQNILTAVDSGSKVQIHFASTPAIDGFAEISIKNTGSSCSPEELDKVFQAGYSSYGDELNQGFGAAIIKKFVELHGGAVRAESCIKQNWFCLFFTLPVSQEDDEVFVQPPECSKMGLS